MATNTDDVDRQDELERLESIGLGSDAVTDITIEADGVSVRKAIGDYDDHSRIGFVLRSTHERPVRVTMTDSLPASVSVGRIGFHPDFHGDSWESTSDDRVTFTRELDPGQSLTTLYGIELTDGQNLQAFHHPPAISAEPTVDDPRSRPDDAESQTGADQRAVAERMDIEDGYDPGTSDVDLAADSSQEDIDQAVGEIDISGDADVDSGVQPRDVDLGALDSAVSADHSIVSGETVSRNSTAPTNGQIETPTLDESEVGANDKLDSRDADGKIELGESEMGPQAAEEDPDIDEDLAMGNEDDLDVVDEEDLEIGDEDGGSSELTLDPPDGAEGNPDDDSSEDTGTSLSADDDSVLDALVSELDERELTEQQRQTFADAIGVESSRSDEVRLDHIHARVDELMAYRNALETFIDANGTAPELIESFESELADVRSELSTIDETITDTTDALDDLESAIEATTTDVADTEDELERVRNRLDDLQSVTSTVDDLDALTEELREDISGLEKAVQSDSERFETRFDELDERVDARVEKIDDRVAETEASFEERVESLQRDLDTLQSTVEEGAEWRSAINQSFLNVADIPGQSIDGTDMSEHEP